MRRALLVVTVLVAATTACTTTGSTGDARRPSGTSHRAADQVDAEVADLRALMKPRSGEVNVAELRKLVDPPGGDGPFFMVNLIEHRAVAKFSDGRETDLTGREADQTYTKAWMAHAADIGAKPVFAALVERDMLAEQQGRASEWDQVAVAWYPSRAAFVDLVRDPSFRKALEYKDAGIERSIVLVAERTDIAEVMGITPGPNVDLSAMLARPDPATTTYPATATDRPIVMAHLIDFRHHAVYADGRATDLTGREAVRAYSANAGKVAFPMGVRPIAAFKIEGELIGDGRHWDQFRINWFPSHATFEALTHDPTWAVGYADREAGIKDTYALMTAPLLDALPPERTP